jgi:hypothetical protein
MDNKAGFKIMEEVIKKLSRGKIISASLSEAFVVARSGCDSDFSVSDYNELQLLGNEYDNQMKYETPTVNSSGEFNNAYESLFYLSDRLRSLAERIITSNNAGGA